MERLTEQCWKNLDPWECCGQDKYCRRGCHDLDGCTGGCIVPKLYAQLGKYEDTGLTPEEVKAVKLALMGQEIAKIKEFDGIPIERLQELAKAEKDNAPLTLDELREMDGEPVWIQAVSKPGMGRYEVLGEYSPELNAQLMAGGKMMDCNTFGKTWLAYRRKPEEGTE